MDRSHCGCMVLRSSDWVHPSVLAYVSSNFDILERVIRA